MSPRRLRRPQGDGAIFPYKKGFAAVIDLGWSGGKRHRRWVYGKTESIVLARMNEAKRAVAEGVDLTAPPRTFNAWADEWLQLKRQAGTRPTTLRGYTWLLDQHIRPSLGTLKLNRITPTMIRRLLEEKNRSGLSTATVRHIHGLIRNVLGDAEREELLSRNPAKLVKPPALQRDERRALTIDEARRLLESIRGDRLETAWVCALSLGLRRGELLGLRWVDVDFVNGFVAIKQTIQRVDGTLLVARPKTERSTRTIPVPSAVLNQLLLHMARQDVERQQRAEKWHQSGLVFTSNLGTPLEPRNLDRAWHAARQQADLNWVRLHDLRHACATFLLLSGASPRTVMQTLGHSQIGLTMNTYAHVLPEIERAAVDEAARSLFGGSQGD